MRRASVDNADDSSDDFGGGGGGGGGIPRIPEPSALEP
jgi:hypothetical protein